MEEKIDGYRICKLRNRQIEGTTIDILREKIDRLRKNRYIEREKNNRLREKIDRLRKIERLRKIARWKKR